MSPRDGLSAIRANAVPKVPRTASSDSGGTLPSASPAWDDLLAAVPATPSNLEEVMQRAMESTPDPPEQDELALVNTDARSLAYLQEMLKAGVPRASACRLVGLNPRQVSGWLADCVEPLPAAAPALHHARRRAVQQVVSAIQDAEALLIAELSVNVIKRAKDGDVKVAMWALERRGGKAWTRPAVVKHEGRTTHEHKHLVGHVLLNPATLSDAQLAEVQRMLTLQGEPAQGGPVAVSPPSEAPTARASSSFAEDEDDG